MDNIVKHWVERAEYDLGTAKAMLDAARYLYVAYTSQQAIEKILKGIIACQNKENLPIHNLNRLAEIAELKDDLTPVQFDFLAELTPYCIEARYGDYKENLSEIIDMKKASEIYNETERLFRWLLQKIN